jgi:hypothetical protein
VLLRLNDSRLHCEEMDVRLDRRIEFAEDRPEGEKASAEERPQIKQVVCRDGVRLEIYEWAEAEKSRLVGIRKAELADFTLDYATGAFTGQGPGTINDWSRGGAERVSVAPNAVARANEPTEPDKLEWDYMNVRFSQTMTGNFKERIVELRGRVRAISAPVEHALETFAREDLSGDSPSAPHAVWLGCDQMSISLHPWDDLAPEPGMEQDEPREGEFATLAATGHCELEGQVFRAVADVLSYDESKVLFTLKGLGNHEACIYYQKQPGEEPSRSPAQTIQFIPSQQRIKLDGSRGIQGVQ